MTDFADDEAERLTMCNCETRACDPDCANVKDIEDALRIQCVNEHANAQRVIDWINDPHRKPAITAFTGGPERQIAYAFENAWRTVREP